jgi:hypothetical protein
VPEYPLCSAWALDASFAPARFDGVGGRAGGRGPTARADHSALLTFVSLALQRVPGLLQRLYRLGSPEEVVSGPLRVAAVLGAGSAAPPVPPSPEQRYAQTTALYRHLAAAVQADGSRFLAVIGSQEIERFDREALARAGIDVHALEIRSRVLRPADVRFRNDAHFNARGHELIAEHLAPVLARALAAPPPPRRS